MMRETINYGRLGGTLTPPSGARVTWRHGLYVAQFAMLVKAASLLMRDGYGVDAERVYDLLTDWARGGDPPTDAQVAEALGDA